MSAIYITNQGATVQRRSGQFLVCKGSEILQNIPETQVRQLVLFGNVNITTPAVAFCLDQQIDVVFLSPPWGGPEYLNAPVYSLARTRPEPAAELFRLARLLTPNVAFYVPRNTALEDVALLLPESVPANGIGGDEEGGTAASAERVEVEEEWMGTKLKALTCYFGGLAQGQEHLF